MSTENERLINDLLRVLSTEEQRCRDELSNLQDRAARGDARGDDEDDEATGESPAAVPRIAIDCMALVRKLIVGRSVDELHKVFGAPGDWGYETPIGDALSKLYRGATREPKADPVTDERAACAAIAMEVARRTYIGERGLGRAEAAAEIHEKILSRGKDAAK